MPIQLQGVPPGLVIRDVAPSGSGRFALDLADVGRARLGGGPETVKARGARQKRLAFRAGKQGCMYHI